MVVEQPDLPDSVAWPEKTRQWWESLPDTPGADAWSASDWEFMQTTALLHAQVWGKSDFDRLSELRIREEEMGITPSARRKLGVEGPKRPEREEAAKSPLESIAEERRLSLHVTRPSRKAGA